MTTPHIRLLSLRLTGILSQGFLLVAATVLFGFGMLEVFNTLAAIALTLTWVVLRPETARALAATEFTSFDLARRVRADGTAGNGLTEEQYTRLRAFRTRRRVRRSISLPRDRFDVTHAVITTLVWLSYISFLSSVMARG